MELIFIGTGASELWPSAFCGCGRCRRAVAGRGRGHRVGSCLLVDGAYLFDLPPNSALAAICAGVSLAEVRHLFITHSHQDHFDPGVLAASGRSPERPLHLYCNQRVAELLPFYQRFNRFFDPARLGLAVRVVAPFEVVAPPDDEFILRVLPAEHDHTGGEAPLVYVFERDAKRLLYACDTGWFSDRAWQEIERFQYDAVVLECTFHERLECRRGHLSLGPFLEVKRRFADRGLLTSSAVFIAQHLAHEHCDDAFSEEDLAARLAAEGVVLARDGMRVEL